MDTPNVTRTRLTPSEIKQLDSESKSQAFLLELNDISERYGIYIGGYEVEVWSYDEPIHKRHLEYHHDKNTYKYERNI